MSTDIELVTKALSDFDAVAAGLAQLEKTHKGVLFEVETHSGMELAKAARAMLRKPRYEIENIRKAAKAPLLAIGKKLDAEAARITAAILALEEPIDQQIKHEETRKEREKQAKIEAEQKRVADILARIEAIRLLPSRSLGKSSVEIKDLLDQAAAIVINESFGEYSNQASTALHTTVLALQGAHAERLNYENEQARILAERAELERLRAEQAERDRQAQAARDAEAVRQTEALKAEREALERQAAAMRQAQETEAARLAAARAELEREQAEAKRKAEEAERARLAAEAAEAARKEEVLRAAKKAKYPGDQAILDALAKHFDVSEQVVRGWLTQLKAAA